MWMWVLLLVTQTARVASSRPAPRVEIARGETSCRVTVGGELFTEYRWTEGISPVLYPVLGEGGIHMTRGWPLSAGRAGEARDHPHHRSLWFAHGEVNGNDFWSGRRGARIVQRELAIREEGPGPAIVTRNDWLDGDGKRVSRDRRRVSFAARDGMRIIDFEIEIEASDGALRFGDTKEGSMAIRMAPELRLWGKIARGKVRNSEGVSGKGVWGKRARWVAYQASLDDRNFGLALLDHPENHGYPC
ncbi:MAG: PmoA family protein, partial [Planctomycetota bacterium]